MKKFLISTAAVALTMAAVPASAQLLGGGGGGMLGGGLGGQLGAPMGMPSLPQLPSRIDRTIDTSGQGTLSTRGERHVDTRKGSVSASRSVDGSLAGTLNSTSENPAAPLTGSASGSANGSASGNANAQLIGTDAVRSATGQAVGTARDRVQMTRDRALTTVGNTRDRATAIAGNARDRATGTAGAVGSAAGERAAALRGTAGSITGSAMGSASGMANGSAASTNGSASGSGSGSGNGMLNGGFGNLALAGTGAANGQGAFAVMPGMQITDVKGKAIGTVQSVATNARGRVQQVRMKVGDKLATLPASNFAGDGNVLVSAMGKGEVKKAAKEPAQPSPQ